MSNPLKHFTKWQLRTHRKTPKIREIAITVADVSASNSTIYKKEFHVTVNKLHIRLCIVQLQFLDSLKSTLDTVT